MSSSFDKITLRAPNGDTADMVANGAHVTSWCTADGVEQLYLSPCSEFRKGAAIRGGVPIIFPQFSTEGPLPRHGMARTAFWQPEPSDDPSRIALVWHDDAHSRNIWPQSFAARYEVELAAGQLSLTLHIHNTGEMSMAFTSALHTYLRVSDIKDVQIAGLHGSMYRDSAHAGELCEEIGDVVTIEGEVDRIYLNTPSELVLRDAVLRQLSVHQQGFQDSVVWNPGPEKCATLRDMPADGYRYMVCIESARIGRPVVLAPGERWSGSQILQVL